MSYRARGSTSTQLAEVPSKQEIMFNKIDIEEEKEGNGLKPTLKILNMDETGVLTEAVSTKTITDPEEGKTNENTDKKKVRVGIRSTKKDKESTSVALSGSWSGVKLQALVL